ncbi:MAG: hypothetical protein Q7J27_08545 [Syntrophales bacterium]|nr:hypothetical protein [Syntrophales bacterium]
MKEIFQAVHSSELESFLTRLGLFDRFKAGDIKCHSCGDVIAADNFKALTRKGNQLLFSCNKENCLLLLASGEEAKQ